MAKTTFAVSDVKPDPKNLQSQAVALPEALPLRGRTFESGLTNHPLSKIQYPSNAFVGTIIAAYNHHLPLELTPDDVWLAFAQGVGIYIAENAEECRPLFVGHEGKLALEIAVDGMGIIPGSPQNSQGWPQAIELMVALMQKHMHGEGAATLTRPFSTTGAVEATAFHCTLMHAMKEFFEYKFSLCCGLPSVTLHGTPEDYDEIVKRARYFEKLLPGFQWWFAQVIPHLQRIADSAHGRPDADWWNRCFTHQGGGSGPSFMCGWVADFIPFVHNGKSWVRPRRPGHHYCQGEIDGIDFAELSPAILETPFTLDDNGREIKMLLLSGFVGISQDQTTGAVRPVIGWATVNDDAKPQRDPLGFP